MYRFNRLNSAEQLSGLTTAVSFYKKRFFRRNALLRSHAFRDPLVTGIDDSVSTPLFFKWKFLPLELSRNVVSLTCESSAYGGLCDVYLVGITHFSTESCQQVKALIGFLKPQVVFMELCSERTDMILPDRDSKGSSNLEPKSDTVPRRYGAKVVLGDRPTSITEQRLLAKMPVLEQDKILILCPVSKGCLMLSRFVQWLMHLGENKEEHLEIKMVDLVIERLRKHFPILIEIFIDERDQYMSAKLLDVARQHNSVVAIVGQVHAREIQKYWKQPVDVKKLDCLLQYQKDSILVNKARNTIYRVANCPPGFGDFIFDTQSCQKKVPLNASGVIWYCCG